MSKVTSNLRPKPYPITYSNECLKALCKYLKQEHDMSCFIYSVIDVLVYHASAEQAMIGKAFLGGWKSQESMENAWDKMKAASENTDTKLHNEFKTVNDLLDEPLWQGQEQFKRRIV